MRAEDIARGQYPPEPPARVNRRLHRCSVCGGPRDYSGVAGASDGALLCWPCAVWALGFETWDDAKPEAEARMLAAAIPDRDGPCPPRY